MVFPQPQNQPLKMDPVTGIRNAQIICVALIMGVVCFVGVALMRRDDPREPMIAYIAAGFAVLNIILRLIVPGLVVRSQLRTLTAVAPEDLNACLFPIYQTRMIIGMALLEAAAFFNLVAYIVEHQDWAFAIVGVLVLMMAMMFPTLQRFENWADDMKRDLSSQF